MPLLNVPISFRWWIMLALYSPPGLIMLQLQMFGRSIPGIVDSQQRWRHNYKNNSKLSSLQAAAGEIRLAQPQRPLEFFDYSKLIWTNIVTIYYTLSDSKDTFFWKCKSIPWQIPFF
jgi:hypothetical protein